MNMSSYCLEPSKMLFNWANLELNWCLSGSLVSSCSSLSTTCFRSSSLRVCKCPFHSRRTCHVHSRRAVPSPPMTCFQAFQNCGASSVISSLVSMTFSSFLQRHIFMFIFLIKLKEGKWLIWQQRLERRPLDPAELLHDRRRKRLVFRFDDHRGRAWWSTSYCTW